MQMSPNNFDEIDAILRRSRQDSAEVHLLYTAIGRAVVALSEVELQLCLLYIVCRSDQDTRESGKFISGIRHISEKIKYVDLLVNVTRNYQECLDWGEIRRKIEANIEIRNRLAHEGIQIVNNSQGAIEAVLSASPLSKPKELLNDTRVHQAADILEGLRDEISDYAMRLVKRDHDDQQDPPWD
ncbi:hypothetical protein ACN9MF_17920 [Methylobacterium fujisawaense]|uniref:hypothetical protein n=1 Tax=Methylobacterium fujisawaense TaxID=107400 RepID=UPI003CF28440